MILSIIVLSYNRPDQIDRLLRNLVGVESNDFELIIKDDCSPSRNNIRSIVDSYRGKLNFNLVFYENAENVGYDLNLLGAFNIANSDFVFLLSDDDFIVGSKINELLDFLDNTSDNVIFTPYTVNGYTSRSSIKIYDQEAFHHIIYNSILFSGLIFRRSSVLGISLDLNFLSSCIYSQVYLSCYLIFFKKSFAVAPEGLLFLGGDGENFFGKNQSAVNRDLLQDRTSIVSNFKYQSLLIKTIFFLANSTDISIYKKFIKQYNIRLVAYFLRARANGFNSYSALYFAVSNSDLELPIFVRFLIFIIRLFPAVLCLHFYRFGLNTLRSSG